MQLQHCWWKTTGTYRFLTGFYGLGDMPAEFQKAMDRTINHAKNTFCFLDDILIVSKGSEIEHELMGPYTNPLWSQMAVQDDCILVNNRLAVPVQLRQAVLKRIHRGHPGHEAMLGAAQYLWWPHMNKDIVNLAEECRSCTRYGKNVKYLISKNTSKPLPLLTQPGEEVQLDYAGPIENQKGKKITF